MRRLLAELHPRRLLFDGWREIDADAARLREQNDGFDGRAAAALVTATVCLIAMETWGGPATILRILNSQELVWGQGGLYETGWLGLVELAWWAQWRVLGFLVVPLVVARLVLRMSLAELGVRSWRLGDHGAVYLGLLLLGVPIVAGASLSEQFLAYYPFHRQASRSWVDLLLWEAMYMAQFLALEFFFRGFVLGACRRAMGSQAIFVAVVPYAMIHLTKPVPEVFGAIVAGVVLGTVAMRTRSIWGGFAVHVAIALGMDLTALIATSGLPAQWFHGKFPSFM